MKVVSSLETNVIDRRIVAALIDVIVVIVIFFIMTIAFGGTDAGNTSGGDGDNTVGFNFSLSGVPFIVTLVLTWAYYAVLEAKNNGQTLGKRVMGIRVVGRDGRTPSFGKSAIRNVLRIVDNFPYFLPLLGLVLIIVTGQHQRIGDMAADTVVVRA